MGARKLANRQQMSARRTRAKDTSARTGHQIRQNLSPRGRRRGKSSLIVSSRHRTVPKTPKGLVESGSQTDPRITKPTKIQQSNQCSSAVNKASKSVGRRPRNEYHEKGDDEEDSFSEKGTQTDTKITRPLGSLSAGNKIDKSVETLASCGSNTNSDRRICASFPSSAQTNLPRVGGHISPGRTGEEREIMVSTEGTKCNNNVAPSEILNGKDVSGRRIVGTSNKTPLQDKGERNEKMQKEKTDKKKQPKAPEEETEAKHVQEVVVIGPSGEEKRYKCNICGKVNSIRGDLIKHIRVHTGTRPYVCKVCGRAFAQPTALKGHQTIHTGEKKFVCDICNRAFAIKDRLRLHMRLHTGEKPHVCSQCGASYPRRSLLTQHLRNHDVDKQYVCSECDASFSSYHILRRHVKEHNGVREFVCNVCGKKFFRMESLKKHTKTVHEGSKPYSCYVCGKAFKGHLRQHMRLHMGMRPFECTVCNATFTQNSQLTVHMRIHTGERPYKCQICNAAFAHSSACKIHMRSHTGEKPFQCEICNAPFSQLPHLKKHMRCVHNASKPYICVLCKDFFQTQSELESHHKDVHGISKTPQQQAAEAVEEVALAKLRNRLAILLYRISSDERRGKLGFGSILIDDVLKLSLESSGHKPVSDSSLSRLAELRQNILILLKWTIPQETVEEYYKNKLTVDEVLDMLTS